MLRRLGARFIYRPATVAVARVSSRALSGDESGTPSPEEDNIVSNSVRRHRQSHSSIPPKLYVKLSIRHDSNRRPIQVDMITVPAMSGQMVIRPGHLPTITELRAGLMTVHEGNDVTKYFISSGFAIVHLKSFADILAGEAVMLDWVDPDKVQMGLTHFTELLSSATNDMARAEAQIGIDVYSALSSALFGKG